MDGELKTLDQLSGSPGDKKYITLDTGSQISGYTKDYLERLCRLDKVECGEWARGKGQFVVELNSLLRETHTLLISHDGLLFVDKREVTLPESRSALGAVPSPGKQPESSASIVFQPSSAPQSIPTWTSSKIPLSPPPPPAMIFQPPPSMQPAVPLPPPSVVAQTPSQPPVPSLSPSPAPILPQQNFGGQAAPPPPPPPPASASRAPTPLPAYEDEWDKLLFAGANNIPEEPIEIKPPPLSTAVPSPAPLYETPSLYRPIETSVDPTPHYDPAPLFPPLTKKVSDASAPLSVSPAPPSPEPHASIPTPSQPSARSTPATLSPQPPTTPRTAPPAPPRVYRVVVPRANTTVSSPASGEPPRVPASPAASIPRPTSPGLSQVLAQVLKQTPPQNGSNLPKIGDEHHLAVPPPHAISRQREEKGI